MSGRTPNGTILQSMHQRNAGDYQHRNINYLIVGIVMKVFPSDHPNNQSATHTQSRTLKHGCQAECEVLVKFAVNDDPWLIPNVVILPRGASGIDDYSEELPRPATQMIDGSQFNGDLKGVDPSKLDGDLCVVGFIGGNRAQAVMLSWYPHSYNRTDPATSNVLDNGFLNQGRRMFRRYRGAKVTITNTGSLYLDTNESNANTTGTQAGWKRALKDDGGDIQVDVKPSRQVQFNFNPPVAVTEQDPSVPSPVNTNGYDDNNPAKPASTRATTATAVTLDKETIQMIAGEVARIITNNANIEIHAKTKVTVKGDDSTDSVILGDDNPSNCDHAINGETFFAGRYDPLVQFVLNHIHPSAVGPTDKASGPPPFPDPHQTADLSPVVKVKK